MSIIKSDTKAVCQNGVFRSWYEVLSNGIIPFPNHFYILLNNTNMLPKTAFRNSKNFGFYAILKYAKIAPEIVSLATSASWRISALCADVQGFS